MALQSDIAALSGQFRWTDVNVERLRLGLAAKRPARLIAADLGCSRNAVIGKAYALNKAGRGIQCVAVKERSSYGVGLVAPRDVRLLDEIEALPVTAGVPIRDLRARHCRWVTEPEAPWVFCGETATRGSYCEAHAARVYVRYRKGMYE